MNSEFLKLKPPLKAKILPVNGSITIIAPLTLGSCFKLNLFALIFFALGVPAFALAKVLSNFYFARDNTKMPFYISLISMIINITISVSLFRKYGFIIIPIATSLSIWFATLAYFVLLKKEKFLVFENKTLINIFKILIATILMCFFLYFGLEYFEDKLKYTYNFKLIYLLIMISLSAALYLLLTNHLGILKLESYKLK